MSEQPPPSEPPPSPEQPPPDDNPYASPAATPETAATGWRRALLRVAAVIVTPFACAIGGCFGCTATLSVVQSLPGRFSSLGIGLVIVGFGGGAALLGGYTVRSFRKRLRALAEAERDGTSQDNERDETAP